MKKIASELLETKNFKILKYLFELLRERREDFEKKNEVKSKVSY
mgnify:CR=1 FL=1